MDKLLYSINDAASSLSLGRTKVYELIAEGRLSALKMGRRTLITRDSLFELIRIP